jgi:hypothetical protein
MKLASRIFAILWAALLYCPAKAADINAITSSKNALIGSAYRSDRQDFPGEGCVAGDTVSSGTSTSNFTFQNSISETQASKELGLQAGGRARFGVIEASLSANFLQNSVSSAYSVSAIWLSDYVLPTDKLTRTHPSDIGEALVKNFERWKTTCGDEAVVEITRGAKLFFSIRIDFKSKEQKQAFEARFSISGPLASANATLKQATRDFSRDTQITISGFQQGGDVSKLTGVFNNNAQGITNFVQCTLGDLEKCQAVVGSALSYASDTANGFPSQIAPGAKPGGAPLVYRTSPYKDLGIYLGDYPFLAEVIQQSRASLQEAFERQFKYFILIRRLSTFGLNRDRAQLLDQQRAIVDTNVTNVLATSKVCYETPEECPTAVMKLKLGLIDETALELPPLPVASYRILTPEEGLWPRDRSVGAMQSAYKTAQLHSALSNVISNLTPNGIASAVLSISGVGLRDANFKFEDTAIKSVPLTVAGGLSPEKHGEDSAMIVVDTTRGNPGWRDVSLPEELRKLQEKITKADGIFYFSVHDEFGRETRFDFQYVRWDAPRCFESQGQSDTDLPKGTSITTRSHDYRNMLWDSETNGTHLRDVKSFADEGTVTDQVQFGKGCKDSTSPATATSEVLSAPH